MASILPKLARALAVAALAGLALLAWTPRSTAQVSSRDPDDPYGLGTRSTSSRPSGPAAAGGRVGSRAGGSATRRGSAFQDYLDDNDSGSDSDLPGRRRPRGDSGLPFERTGRRPTGRGLDLYGGSADDLDDDSRLDRGQAGGRDSAESQKSRQAKYLLYLKERDPARRSQLYRDYRQNITTSPRADGRSVLGAGSGAAPNRSRAAAPGLQRGGSILDRFSSTSTSTSDRDSSSTSLFRSRTSEARSGGPPGLLNRGDRPRGALPPGSRPLPGAGAGSRTTGRVP